MSRAAEDEPTSAFDIRYRRKDGSYRWISWRVVAHGNMLHCAGRDMTAEKDAMAALRESQEALRRPRNMEPTAQMTSDVAHEFNNLMQSIVASLELVRKLNASGRSGETEQFILRAIGSAERAAALNQRSVGSRSDKASNPDAAHPD